MWGTGFVFRSPTPIRGRSGTFSLSLSAQVSGKEAPHPWQEAGLPYLEAEQC